MSFAITDLREDERGQLDIKWYFNDHVVPFLQWVPGGGRRPQLIEPTLFHKHNQTELIATLLPFSGWQILEQTRTKGSP